MGSKLCLQMKTLPLFTRSLPQSYSHGCSENCVLKITAKFSNLPAQGRAIGTRTLWCSAQLMALGRTNNSPWSTQNAVTSKSTDIRLLPRAQTWDCSLESAVNWEAEMAVGKTRPDSQANPLSAAAFSGNCCFRFPFSASPRSPSSWVISWNPQPFLSHSAVWHPPDEAAASFLLLLFQTYLKDLFFFPQNWLSVMGLQPTEEKLILEEPSGPTYF